MDRIESPLLHQKRGDGRASLPLKFLSASAALHTRDELGDRGHIRGLL